MACEVVSACSQQRPFDASIAAWHQQVSLGEMLNDLRNGSVVTQLSTFTVKSVRSMRSWVCRISWNVYQMT